MISSEGAAGYGFVARLLHWLTALLILAIVPCGLVMTRLDGGPLQDRLFVVHESLGLTILALTIIRLLWRLGHGAPPHSAALTPLEVKASGTVHWLLYALLFAMPLSGYVFVVAGGFPISWFDLFEVPRLLAKDEALSKLAQATHLTLQYAVYGAVGLHAAAALHHHFVKRNDVLSRMLPF